MKLVFVSDIHGSAYYARMLPEIDAREKPERIVLLGDLLYHGPRNDLPRDYNPKEVTAILNGMKQRFLCVRGNCDAEVDQMVLEFPIEADSLALFLGGRMAFVTHRKPAQALPRRPAHPRPHARAGHGPLWPGQPLPQPRLRLPAQGGEREQLHDV